MIRGLHSALSKGQMQGIFTLLMHVPTWKFNSVLIGRGSAKGLRKPKSRADWSFQIGLRAVCGLIIPEQQAAAPDAMMTESAMARVLVPLIAQARLLWPEGGNEDGFSFCSFFLRLWQPGKYTARLTGATIGASSCKPKHK